MIAYHLKLYSIYNFQIFFTNTNIKVTNNFIYILAKLTFIFSKHVNFKFYEFLIKMLLIILINFFDIDEIEKRN
jgi:hypothetical protein